MRSLIVVATAVLLSACASQNTAPQAAVPAPAAAEKKAPQCWNGDLGKFQDVGSKATIAGVAVECKLTSDGKAASWVGGKH